MTVPKPTYTFALLVHTCDRYRFLYPGFNFSFNQYWDFSVPCQYYFATETLNVQLQGFQTIQSGKGEWADRLAYLLREVIEEDYVIYFQEDMWLNKPVNGRFFNELFKTAAAQQWQQVKLSSSDAYVTQTTPYTLQGFQVGLLDNEKSGFLMSHQVTLWKREFLLQQLHKGEHPWRNERKGTKRLKKLNPKIYQIDYFAENGQPENNTNPQATGRSEYQTVSMNSMLSANVLPYIKAFSQGNAEQQAYAQQLQHHYDHQLTHDELPKPRKEDFFKKLKNWWKA
ncbi:hypothetical protein GCM10027037_28350 [Mucilaginibacter koreensis]